MRRAKKRILKACISFVLLALLLDASLIVLSAQEIGMPKLPDNEWKNFTEAIPEEIEESLLRRLCR